MTTFEEWRARYPALLENVYCGWYLPPGWTEPVRKLCDLLATRFPSVRCAQAKEKFGTLRFYVDGAPKAAHALIDACEAATEFICLHCGAPGRVRNVRGWFACLCDGCHEAKVSPP